MRYGVIGLLAALLAGCSGGSEGGPAANGGQGALEGAAETPLAAPRWASARKFGIGTSYEAYLDGAYSAEAATGEVSKVWFSLSQDRITEVMWGLIHEAQIREIRFTVTRIGQDGAIPYASSVSYLATDGDGNPVAPAYVLTHQAGDGSFTLRQTVVADPGRQALLVRLELDTALDGLSVAMVLDAAVANTGTGDAATADGTWMTAQDGARAIAVRADRRFLMTTDVTGMTSAGGDAALLALPDMTGGEALIIVGFGETVEAAKAEADGAMAQGFGAVAAQYVREWEGYLAGLETLGSLGGTPEETRLAHASALVLKVMEDKTYPGALIASLSNPWGETADASTAQTGYKAVWPRDFYQVAMAFLALGDEETAAAAFRYLPQVQVSLETPGNAGVTGWFLQKTHVDGEIEWVAVQLDQTAMPILLGYRLWQAGVIGEAEMAGHWRNTLKPAADFLVSGGRPDLSWNDAFEVVPPMTQQERWEEQWGYSPSTTAAVIAGLVTAAELARAFGDAGDAARYLAAADAMEAAIEARMFTTNGRLEGSGGQYFLRITQNEDPNDRAPIDANNGRPAMGEDMIVDAGFLELVRYGVRAPDAASITASLKVIDDEARGDDLRVAYSLWPDAAPGYRRYGNDGYGEDSERGLVYHELGGESSPGQRGRIWPFLTGERGHYELARAVADGADADALAAIARPYALSFVRFANDGLMLPEQVWDGVGTVNPWGYQVGEGTESATPLAWTHAEYLKLLRSARDGVVWDRVDVVAGRYTGD